jgi:hypothetical protein
MERWDTRVGNHEVAPQEIWPIARALLNRDAPKASTAIHGYSGLKFLPYDRANATADCLENRFTHHDLCDEHHERRMEAFVQDMLETEDTAPPEKIRPRDFKKLIKSLKLKSPVELMAFPGCYIRYQNYNSRQT